MDNVSIKDLKKLKRSELLEIMLAQSREIDSLREQLEDAQKKLEDKRIIVSNVGATGSIADASLQLTKVFEEAQKAADLYVYNIKRLADKKAEKMAAERIKNLSEENPEAENSGEGDKKEEADIE